MHARLCVSERTDGSLAAQLGHHDRRRPHGVVLEESGLSLALCRRATPCRHTGLLCTQVFRRRSYSPPRQGHGRARGLQCRRIVEQSHRSSEQASSTPSSSIPSSRPRLPQIGLPPDLFGLPQSASHPPVLGHRQPPRVPPSHLRTKLSRRKRKLTPSAVGGLAIAGGIGSLVHFSFSSAIIGVYELM